MAYLDEIQLKEMGFKSVGENVKISDKASFYGCDNISIGNNVRIGYNIGNCVGIVRVFSWRGWY